MEKKKKIDKHSCMGIQGTALHASYTYYTHKFYNDLKFTIWLTKSYISTTIYVQKSNN